MIRTTLSVATAVLVAAVTGVVLPTLTAGPAASAGCSGSSGVTAVVDFNELGGGVTAGCDGNGAGKAAAQVFSDAGYSLTFVQQDPGFVCRVSGKPENNPCVRTPPATAYWSLWWSDGRSGEWAYASSGVTSLEVPDGGYVALAWHYGEGRAGPPDVVPTPHQEPEPSDKPSTRQGGTGDDNQNDDQAGPAAGTSATAPVTTVPPSSAPVESATPSRRHQRSDRERGKSDGASATSSTSSGLPGAGDITDGPPPTDVATDTSDDGGGSLSTWIGLGLAGVVFGAAGAVTYLRRRPG